ncbi:MAG: ubiquitin-like small modifier protein 1 [Candidatus Bathyarchaeia archaeon]|nr:MoaD/ThiS family protein [Candidatus Bathyarchaeota archaeon]
MEVKVRLFARLREIAGSREVSIEVGDGSTVEDVVEKLSERFGGEFRRYLEENLREERLYLVLNGVGIDRSRASTTSVRDGDILAIIPPIGGG